MKKATTRVLLEGPVRRYVQVEILRARRGEVKEVTVEGMTEQQVLELLELTLKKCLSRRKFLCCADDLPEQEWEELRKELKTTGEELPCRQHEWFSSCWEVFRRIKLGLIKVIS